MRGQCLLLCRVRCARRGSMEAVRLWWIAAGPLVIARLAIGRLAIDPHSPAEFRCNQIVRNIEEFYDAFAVGASDGLWLDPARRVNIW